VTAAFRAPSGGGEGTLHTVLTIRQIRELLRGETDEYVEHWVRTYAPGRVLSGGRVRVSRLGLSVILHNRRRAAR